MRRAFHESILGLLLMLVGAVCAQAEPMRPFRVQLGWTHQSQFAGFYMADERGDFEAEGLDVLLREGGPGVQTLGELQAGRADVAIAWFDDALVASQRGPAVVNVMQPWTGAGQALIARVNAGISSIQDLRGRRIGIPATGSEATIRSMIRAAFGSDTCVTWVPTKDGVGAFMRGELDVFAGLTYDEYLTVLESGVPAQDLIVFTPAKLHLSHLEGGLYVLEDSLRSERFRGALVGLVSALKRGWYAAQASPTEAVTLVLAKRTDLERVHQRAMLEALVALLPEERDRFGYISVPEAEKQIGEDVAQGLIETPRRPTWTHRIMNEVLVREGKHPGITHTTRLYLERAKATPLFQFLLAIFGVYSAALAGAALAVRRGFGLWGRLAMAVLTAMGGGTLRDLLVGGERMPFYFLRDLTYPTGILVTVLLLSAVVAWRPRVVQTRAFDVLLEATDVVGYAFLAVFGASVAIQAELPWVWAPLCGALTCTGGGLLRRVLFEPGQTQELRAHFYEHAALLGGLSLFLGLRLANRWEYTGAPVQWSLAISVLLVIALQIVARLPKRPAASRPPERA